MDKKATFKAGAGKVRITPPVGIPDGPIDPDLDVIAFRDKDDKPIAVLVNFACHAVSCSPPVPNLISAGFPGAACNLIEQATGATCLYTAGAGGDIRSYRSTAAGFAEAGRIGMALASGVLAAMKKRRTGQAARSENSRFHRGSRDRKISSAPGNAGPLAGRCNTGYHP
ncbi:MAG: hypothetical protein SVV80_09595 [Planctomycetota bacterium]|nr:hypothetical protein [Planctomycetota bacterium]